MESVIRGFRGKREAETTTMANFAFSNVTEWDELVDEGEITFIIEPFDL